MNADKIGQTHPEQTVCMAWPAGTRPAMTSHRSVLRARRHRVLVLHGDEEIRGLIAISLTLEGYDVTTAASEKDCLYKARAAFPDILITTHLTMGDPGQCTAAARLRRHLANSDIKVLLISTVTEPEEDPVASTAAYACLSTPFDPAEMLRAVRTLAATNPSDLLTSHS